MAEEDNCPVCKTPVPAGSPEPTECADCGAELTRGDDGGWVLAGDAPAG